MSPKRHLFVSLFFVIFASGQVHASPSPYPPDRQALTLYLPDGRDAAFSLNDLRMMPSQVITTRESNGTTETRWTGVPLATLLARANGSLPTFKSLRLKALNTYSVIVPAKDVTRYDPMVAYLRDGQAMSISDYGPLYLIYPFDAYPELRVQVYYNRSIWQLSEIHVE